MTQAGPPLTELRPQEILQRLLVSTTSRLYGEFASEGVLVSHAWPPTHDTQASARIVPGPNSRSTYIFSFETPPQLHTPGVVVPYYGPTGNTFCAYLAALFGKRFDNHGAIQSSGIFYVPSFSVFGSMCIAALPQNTHHVRADFPIPLNLTELRRLEPLWNGGSSTDPGAHQAFEGACLFYLRALQTAEDDPEVAYLHLITTGEILAGAHEVDESDLLDDDLQRAFEEITKHVPKGDRVVRMLSRRLGQITRRYARLFTDYVDESFFERREASEPYEALSSESFRTAITAAYHLRSAFVHSGARFGSWVSASWLRNGEVQLGQPVIDDPELQKAVSRAPTLVGLERVTRYVLLRFAEKRLGLNLEVAISTS